MPVLTGMLQHDGPLVDVAFGWSAVAGKQERAALRPVPPPLRARALVDTGAEITCVDAALIQQLGLPFGAFVPANLPAHGGLTFGVLHDASLAILHPSGNARDHLTLLNLSVLELSLSSLGYQACIGRDVLARCRFLYHGPRNAFRLRY